MFDFEGRSIIQLYNDFFFPQEDSPETCEGTEAGHDQSDPIVDSSKVDLGF